MNHVFQTPIFKVKDGKRTVHMDFLAVEEPMEIRLGFGAKMERQQKSISVTMRTVGNDFELALGFLFTEGIIQSYDDVYSIKHCVDAGKQGANENIVRVELQEDVSLNLSNLERNFYTTSSCGVCGKASIDAIKVHCPLKIPKNTPAFSSELIHELPDKLRQKQAIFEHTGGLHAAALFDTNGNVLMMREDVGRHNAMDKLIGATLLKKMLPLSNYLVLLSGRSSFELVQKAWVSGVGIVAAVGAPSSLAVQLAREAEMTLLGFVRQQRFNIYSGEWRIV